MLDLYELAAGREDREGITVIDWLVSNVDQ